ncbi:MAG: hypothetical protein H6767_08595 [Candidatus Peribacteria bacterium]|nr:MAG: hypothetical protein H6767_08595 [Candidatus Peribacteria bacterium]
MKLAKDLWYHLQEAWWFLKSPNGIIVVVMSMIELAIAASLAICLTPLRYILF